MNFQDFEQRLDEYRAGELPEREAAEMEAFMFENAQARQAHEADDALGAMLRSSLTDYPPVSQDHIKAIARRAMREIEGEAAAGGVPAQSAQRKKPATWGLLEWMTAPLRQPQLAAALAGVFIVGAAAGWGLRPQATTTPNAAGTIASETNGAASVPTFYGNENSDAIKLTSASSDAPGAFDTSAIIQKSAILEGLQPVKYGLLASGNNAELERLRQFEHDFAQMMPPTGQGASDSNEQTLAAYQAGETALLEGNIALARTQFAQTRELDKEKKGILGFLATMHLASLAFHHSEDYPQALTLFESCLNDYPASFISDQNKADVQKKVELITRNSADDYRPLRLYNQALNSKPDLARVHFEQLMSLYPNSTVTGEAVDQLLHLALDYPDKNLLPANDALNLFIVFVEKFPESHVVPRVRVAMGDIYLYRFQRTQQAMLLYMQAMEQTRNSDSELKARVSSRVQYMVDNGMLGE